MKNYEKMWNDLKSSLNTKLEYHKSGAMQSLSEAVRGEVETGEMIKMMEKIENESE